MPGDVVKRLGQHELDPNWLPEGLFDELDELHEEHHRHLRQVRDALTERKAATAQMAVQDRHVEELVTEAYRRGNPPPIVENRPTEADREAMVAPLRERCVAALTALSEFAERAVAVFRARETEWLAALTDHIPAIENQKREAARLLDEANAREFRTHQLGRWVQMCADDLAGQQPAPPHTPAPAQWARSRDALERPWHRHRPWNPASVEAYRESGHAPPPIDEGRLAETRRAAQGPMEDVEDEEAKEEAIDRRAGLEPLDDDVRFGGRAA